MADVKLSNIANVTGTYDSVLTTDIVTVLSFLTKITEAVLTIGLWSSVSVWRS